MKSTFVVLISSIIIINVVGDNGRIFGGHKAEDETHPYIVSAWTKKTETFYSFCGGAILNEFWILTAAHCGNVTFVKMGNNDLSEQNITHYVSDIVTYNYNNVTTENDFQLLKLINKITFIPGRVESISIYNGTIANDAQLYLSGWGWIQEYQISMNLQVLNYTHVNQSTCLLYNEKAPKRTGVVYYDKTHMCALSDVKTGVCYGDSGGPLVYNGQIVGIASRLMSLTCSSGYPDIFTNIQYFAPIIIETIKN